MLNLLVAALGCVSGEQLALRNKCIECAYYWALCAPEIGRIRVKKNEIELDYV